MNTPKKTSNSFYSAVENIRNGMKDVRKSAFVRTVCIAGLTTTIATLICGMMIESPGIDEIRKITAFILLPGFFFLLFLTLKLKTSELYWIYILAVGLSMMAAYAFSAIDPEIGIAYYLPLSALLFLFGAALHSSYPRPILFTIAFVAISIAYIYSNFAANNFTSKMVLANIVFLTIVSLECLVVFNILLKNFSRSIKAQKNKVNELNEINSLFDIALNESSFGIIGYDKSGHKYLERGALIDRLYDNTKKSDKENRFNSAMLEPMQNMLESQSGKPFNSFFRDSIEIKVDNRHYLVHAHKLDEVTLITHIDISQLREIEARLRVNQQLSLLGQISSGVAHNYNNALAIALSNLETIPAQENKTVWNNHIDPAIQAIEQSTEISRKLLAMSGRQQLTIETFDISESVNNMKNLLRSAIGESIDLRINAKKPLWISTDKNEFEASILNLAINARNAISSSNGQISITTKKSDDKAIVEVMDNGSGISMDNQKRIFEPFFTTGNSANSTGLGLSIVKGFVERSNGHVSFQTDSTGTKFILSFPIVKAAKLVSIKPVHNSDSKHPNFPIENTKVLIVDDNPQILRAFKMIVTSHGQEAITEISAPHSIEIIEQDPEIGIAFLDYEMPEMNGVELAHKLRKIRPDIVLYLITGDISRQARAQIAKADDTLFQGFYLKPVRARKIFEILDSAQAHISQTKANKSSEHTEHLKPIANKALN